MPTAKQLMDLAGEIEVNKGLREVHSKNLEARQPSLFDAATSAESEKANKEGMKKAAVEKLDKQEAEKEAKKRAAENKYFEDKRVKPSPIVVEAELAKMKEILAKPKGGGGGGGIPSDKMDKMKKMNYKSGGTVKSSASKRADGIAIRGKTRA
jgi:hypothetical protein